MKIPWSATPEEIARALVHLGETHVTVELPIEGGLDGQSFRMGAEHDALELYGHVVEMLARIITSARAHAHPTVMGTTAHAVTDGPRMTVREAAEKLGITESGVRQAIYAGRLVARKEGGTHWVAQSSVEKFRVSNRGPRGLERAKARKEEGKS